MLSSNLVTNLILNNKSCSQGNNTRTMRVNHERYNRHNQSMLQGKYFCDCITVKETEWVPLSQGPCIPNRNSVYTTVIMPFCLADKQAKEIKCFLERHYFQTIGVGVLCIMNDILFPFASFYLHALFSEDAMALQHVTEV